MLGARASQTVARVPLQQVKLAISSCTGIAITGRRIAIAVAAIAVIGGPGIVTLLIASEGEEP